MPLIVRVECLEAFCDVRQLLHARQARADNDRLEEEDKGDKKSADGARKQNAQTTPAAPVLIKKDKSMIHHVAAVSVSDDSAFRVPAVLCESATEQCMHGHGYNRSVSDTLMHNGTRHTTLLYAVRIIVRLKGD